MTKFQRLIAYAAMTAAVFNAALFVNAQQTGSPYVNAITGPGTIDRGGASSVDTSGVNNTYGASSNALGIAATVSDAACIVGSATKRIHVSRITVSGSAGTLVSVPVMVMKRSAVNTGGTAASSDALPAAYAYYSTNIAATALFSAYTANPTINDTTPGILGAAMLTLPTTATTLTPAPVVFSYGNNGGTGQPTLLSAAQALCVNLNGQAVSSGKLYINFEFTED